MGIAFSWSDICIPRRGKVQESSPTLGVLNLPRHVKAAGVPSQGCKASTSVTVRGFFASQAESPQPCGSSQPAMPGTWGLDEMGSWCAARSRPEQCRSS